jgi:hypothetical protein
MSNLKESENVTTDKVDKTEIKLFENFNKVFTLLQDIAKKIPEAEKEFEPIAYLIKSLKDTDVLIEYKIVAHSKNGEIFKRLKKRFN